MSANKVLRVTGAAAIAAALSEDGPIELVCVKLHLSANGGAVENFTVTVDSASGSAYDTLLFSQDMNTVRDILWLPNQPIPIVDSDEVDIAYANTNTRTYGLKVIWRKVVA